MNLDNDTLLTLARAAAASPADGRDVVAKLALRAKSEGLAPLATELESLVAVRAELPIGLYPLKPKKTLAELKLTPEVQVAIDDFLLEQRERDTLTAGGMEPRHKALLIGPPGNGKTVLAGATALELGVPSYMVRYDDLISKIPGETSRNLLQVFQYAARQPTLLFFDEFDALGREREDAQESGEMKRVTSTLLVQLDDVPSHVVCMAATNHAQMLDGAIWRRFNIRIELPRPRMENFVSFLEDMFTHLGHPMKSGEGDGEDEVDFDIIAHRLVFENFSDAELFARNCIRTKILAKGALTTKGAIMAELNKWANGQKRLVV